MKQTLKIAILLAAGGADWEASALEVITAASPRLVLLKRCMDVDDLLASAAAGSASVALIGSSVSGLDAEAVATLKRSGLRVVVVDDRGAHARLERLGIDHVVSVAALARLPGVLEGATPRLTAPGPVPVDQEASAAGEVIVIWGPTGAPGRTTVAVALATELAHRGIATVLLDADQYGGAVAQHLGILDQVPGLLAAARLANAGHLDATRLVESARQVSPHLRVLSGLPRADRWVEVRGPAFDAMLAMAATLLRYVVVDVGFCVESDPEDHPMTTGRNAMATAALARASRTIVVGAADPVGLSRLVRALHDLGEGQRQGLFGQTTPLVVVNRMRASLGWSELDVTGAIKAVAPESEVRFLPEDRSTVDRALMAGRSLVESGESALRKAVAGVADYVESSK